MNRRSATRTGPIAGIRPLAVAGNRRGSTSLQVEPPDALVVEVAEVERAVRPDREAVRVVDLPIRVAGRAGADQGGHGSRGVHPNGAHQPDEHCRIDDLVNATKVLALATLDLMGAGR